MTLAVAYTKSPGGGSFMSESLNVSHVQKTGGFHQKYSDIKTPRWVLILKRAGLNQATCRISVGGIYNL